MKALLIEDHHQDQAVSRDCNGIQKTKGNGEPDLGCFQAWDTSQEEDQRLSIGVIEDHHSEGLRRQGYLNN
jgi:hypothetical protein